MSQLMGIITRLQSLQETAEAANEPMQRETMSILSNGYVLGFSPFWKTVSSNV